MYFVTVLQYYSVIESSKIHLYYRDLFLRLFLFFYFLICLSIWVYSLVRIKPVLNTFQLFFIAKPRKFRSRLFVYPSYQSSLIRQIYKSLLNKILKPLAFVLGKIVTFSASKTGLQALSLHTLLTLYVPLRLSKGSRILRTLRALRILKIVRILKVLRSKGSSGAILPVFISQCQAVSLC